MAKMGEKEWYFFSLRDRKYPMGLRTNRATEAGYWKATGKDREVHSGSSGALLGMKKTLVFYRGRAPRGEKTKWVMHEYRLEGDFSCRRTGKEEWVICRIFQKTMEKKITILTQCQSYINFVPHQENYIPCEFTKLIRNPNPSQTETLFFPNNRDLLIPARDKAAPVPKQWCKSEEDQAYNHYYNYHQLLLPHHRDMNLASTDHHFHHQYNIDYSNDYGVILQNPNFLIFEMGCCFDGVNPNSNFNHGNIGSSTCNSSSSCSAMSRALGGSSWPLLDP